MKNRKVNITLVIMSMIVIVIFMVVSCQSSNTAPTTAAIASASSDVSAATTANTAANTAATTTTETTTATTSATTTTGSPGNGPAIGAKEGATEVLPGPAGGVETPMATSDGIVYVPLLNDPGWFLPNKLAYFDFATGNGGLTALDVNTGKMVWDKILPSYNFGGATVVNDLVFTATYDGTVYAFNKTSGDQVWTYKITDGGVNAWPAVTKDTIVWPVGVGSTPKLYAFRTATAGQASGSAPAAYENAPSEVNQNLSDWPISNANYENTRSTKTATISSSNAASLAVAWTFDLPLTDGFAGAAASTPVIIGNTVYFQDLNSNIYAIDLATGKLNWKKMYNLPNYGPNGLSIGYGKIFVLKGNYEVAAVDINTGKELWSSVVFQVQTTGMDIQTTVWNNTVYVSTVPGTQNANWYTGGGHGVIYALDATTGKIKWSFNTVNSADIWGNPDVNSGGGCWYPPAIDTKIGITYWAVANPAPWPGTDAFPNQSSIKGPDLYCDSLVALSPEGKLLWYNQVLPQDLFDHDLQISPMLTTATINGKSMDVIIVSGKMGIVYALDKANGTLLWKTPVGQHKNDDLTSVPEGNATTTTTSAQ
jgi:outer membrane protein assembly factor BamB